MTSLWRNSSGNVVAISNWSCLLISAPKLHWRVQPTAARQSSRFNKMHGALRALHVSLNNASMRTVHWWLKRKNDHQITLQIWMEWRYRVWEATLRSYFETFVRRPKQFPNWKSNWRRRYRTINKAVVSIRNSLTRVRERRWKTFWTFYLLKQVFTLTVCALSWIVETVFDNVSTAKLPWSS